MASTETRIGSMAELGSQISFGADPEIIHTVALMPLSPWSSIRKLFGLPWFIA